MIIGTLIWIDDLRNPKEKNWSEYISKSFKYDFLDDRIIWVKSYSEFCNKINELGDLPEFISFDHDLGDISENEKTGYDCCKYVVDYCLNNDCDIPIYMVHSSNSVGSLNIRSLMDEYHKFYKNK